MSCTHRSAKRANPVIATAGVEPTIGDCEFLLFKARVSTNWTMRPLDRHESSQQISPVLKSWSSSHGYSDRRSG
jgi:hypothetical protein